MARLKPSLICVVLMVFLRSNQAQQQGPLANISVAEAATAAANARHWMQRQNAGRTLGSGCSGDKCVEACGEDWEKNGDHCYFWGTDKKNWTEAEDFCQREGGHLASVTSNATRDFVLEGMNRTGLNEAYIGGNDIEEEGTWKWTDCTPWGVTFWASRQPDNSKGNENCLGQVLKWTYDGRKGWNPQWNDGPCSYKSGFVCSKKICPGLGPCPFPYTEIPGDVGGWGSLEGHSSIDTVLSCAGLCDGNPACCSFEYSSTEKKCNLNRECQPTKGVYRDYAFCVQGGSVLKHTTENAVTGVAGVTGDSMMWKPASGFLISTILLLLFLF